MTSNPITHVRDPPESTLKYLLADLGLYLVHGVSELLGDGLSLEGVNVEAVGLSGEDKEGHHRYVRLVGLEEVIEAGQRLQEQVGTFVGELVPGGKSRGLLVIVDTLKSEHLSERGHYVILSSLYFL